MIQDTTIKTYYVPSTSPPIGQVIFVNFNCALNAIIYIIAGLIDTRNESNIRLDLQSTGTSPAFGIWGSQFTCNMRIPIGTLDLVIIYGLGTPFMFWI